MTITRDEMPQPVYMTTLEVRNLYGTPDGSTITVLLENVGREKGMAWNTYLTINIPIEAQANFPIGRVLALTLDPNE